MKAALLILWTSVIGTAAAAEPLDVDFQVIEDGEMAGCAGSVVSGLDPKGDGFLAVRSGPGASYTKIDELKNGDTVGTCAQNGAWIGIIYDRAQGKGWVHGKWLTEVAG